MGKRIIAVILAAFYLFTSLASPVVAAVSYSYDANGNMTSDGTYCYEFNEANQIKNVKKCITSELIAEYYYDYQGNRKWKKIYANGVLQKKVFEISDEYDLNFLASNSAYMYSTYYYENGKLVGKKNPDGSKNYLHGDHLGSTTLLTKQDGTLAENTTYDPFGEVTSGGTKSKFLYTGQEKDPETSLNYYNARYYNSRMRRFTQPDTLIADVYNPQDLNRYSYVNNNPLTYDDPTGHFWQEIPILGLEAFTLGFAASGFSTGWQYSSDTTFTGRFQSGLAGANDLLQTSEGQFLTNTLFLAAGLYQPRNASARLSETEEVGNKPYSNSRPPYAKGQEVAVYGNAAKASPNGKVYDPNIKELELPWDRSLPRNGQWDMGHIPQQKYSTVHARYMNGEMTKQEFLNWYRDPNNYRPESPSINRSNKY